MTIHTGLDTYRFWLRNAPDEGLRDELRHIKSHARAAGFESFAHSTPYLADYDRIAAELFKRFDEHRNIDADERNP